MKGRLIDFSFGYNRKPRVTIELDSDFRCGYDKLKDVDVEVSIKKWRARRSNDANKYFHVLVNEIAAAQGLSDDEVKRDLVVQYGTVARDESNMLIGIKLPASVDVDGVYPYTRLFKTVEENGRTYNCYLLYKHSSDMDTKEMSRLIEGALTVAHELNIDTDTADKAAWWESLKGVPNGRNDESPARQD